MPSLASSPSPQSFRPSMRDTLQACAAPKDDDRQGRCAYPSKPCPNARAVKLNGDCHNFCEFHRRKANMNQRRWQQRRRRMRHVGDGHASPTLDHQDHADHNQQLTPRADPVRSDEIESAQAVMMLQQAGSGRYSPVPAHNWPRYPVVAPPVQWAPRPNAAPVAPQSAPMYSAASFRSASVNVLESTLPRAAAYSPPTHTMGSMIPPLRSLPLPPLLPSVLAPLKTTSSPPRAPPSASVYTC